MSDSNMNDVTIRRAAEQDAPALAHLCAQLGYPTDQDVLTPRLAAILGRPDQAVFVAAAPSGEVIGWLHVLTTQYLESEAFAEIGGIVVDERQRRGGAGRALMQAAEAWAVVQGMQSVRLRSNVIREKAHLFYRSIGYQQVKSQYTFEKELDQARGGRTGTPCA